MARHRTSVEIGLHGVVVAIDGDQPTVLTVDEPGSLPALPFGPFDPQQHRTFESGLRRWVRDQTRLSLGYVEQLYTFGDRGRSSTHETPEIHFVSVGYLALVKNPNVVPPETGGLNWSSWYSHFPWEDWRQSQPGVLFSVILPALSTWVAEDSGAVNGANGMDRLARFRLAFGCDPSAENGFSIKSWDEERVLERYELMYEAGLVDEAVNDGRRTSIRMGSAPGKPMLHDHRRILATAMARLRAKSKYRPVVFELLPESFTLTELQKTVETLSGRCLHKQNFRRLVEKADLVQPTGATTSQTGGRPAAYFRFKRSITSERPAPGIRVGRVG